MIASVTELHLKNFWSFLRFLPLAVTSKMQADKSPGLLKAQVGAKGWRIQRTLTVWNSEREMLAYMTTGAHLKAMQQFRKIANTSYTARIQCDSPPTWDAAFEYLITNGRAHKT